MGFAEDDGSDPVARLACQKGYDYMIRVLRSLGFVSNDEKNVPPTKSITFLGGGLDTNTDGTGVCSVFLDERKRMRVHKECALMAATKGRARAGALVALLGLLMFCSYIVPGTEMYLRSGFDLIRDSTTSEFVSLSMQFRNDVHTISRMFAEASPRMLLVKRELTTTFGSWDTSTSWGMGGFLDGRWFSEKWTTFFI